MVSSVICGCRFIGDTLVLYAVSQVSVCRTKNCITAVTVCIRVCTTD